MIGENGDDPPTCGSDAIGGIPAPPSGSIQYDNAGAFGGAAVTGSISAPANGNLLIGNGSGWTVAPLTGTANQLSVTNGAGSITLALTGPYTPATYTAHSLLTGEGTSSINALGVATNGQLAIGSAGADPVLATLTGTANQVSVTNGAGSITLALAGPFTPATFTAHAVLVGEGTSSIVAVGSSAAGQLLQGAGASSDPAFTATPTLGVAGTTQGTLTLAGATAGTVTFSTVANITTPYTLTFPGAPPSQGSLADFSNASGQLGTIAAVATGQTLISRGTNTVPVWSNALTLSGTTPSLTISSTSGNSVLNTYAPASTSAAHFFGYSTGPVNQWELAAAVGAAGAQGAFSLIDVVNSSATVMSVAASTDAITITSPTVTILSTTSPGLLVQTQSGNNNAIRTDSWAGQGRLQMYGFTGGVFALGGDNGSGTTTTQWQISTADVAGAQASFNINDSISGANGIISIAVTSDIVTFSKDIATSSSTPSLTAGCNSTGSGVAGTDTTGVITTQSSGAATTCTLTKSGSACANAWDCSFTDANASTSPKAYSTGAKGVSTAVVDFASATSTLIEYTCFCR